MIAGLRCRRFLVFIFPFLSSVFNIVIIIIESIINILSTNAAIDRNLNVDVDIVIITSPECDTIEEYFSRLTNVNFSQNGLKLFSIFVKNSSEEKKQLNRPLSEHHIVVNSEKMLNLSPNYQYNPSN